MSEDQVKVFEMLSTDFMVQQVAKLSSIPHLEPDPYLNGAGLHAHGRHGRLGLHLDYERHPILKDKQRRLNLILYLSQDWDPSWNGAMELWNSEVTKCEAESPTVFNSAIIFQTDQVSWHRLPKNIMCPEGVKRQSLTFYYICPLEAAPDKTKVGAQGDGYRYKAYCTKRPDDIDHPDLPQLYKIRETRRIEKSDLAEHWPEWTPEVW